MARFVIRVKTDNNEIEEFERYNPDDAEKVRSQFVEEFGTKRVTVLIDGEKIDSALELYKRKPQNG